MELHRVVVHLSGTALLQDAPEKRERIPGIFRIGQAVDRGDHILSLHLAARMELDPLAQGERPDAAVLIGLPACRKAGPKYEVRAVDAEELADLLEQHHREEGSPCWVDLTRRRIACDAHRGARLDRGPDGRRCCSETSGQCSSPKKRQRQPKQTAVPQELSASNTALDMTIDQMILERSEAEAKTIEQVSVSRHGDSPFHSIEQQQLAVLCDRFVGHTPGPMLLDVKEPI